MQVGLISLLDGLVYGMLLFMLASGLTLILSMMGVLNFAHASIYMLGAYFAYQISRWIGFWPALLIAPVLCGAIGAAIEVWGLRRVHHNGHIAELLFTFGLVFIIGRAVQMAWGMLPMPYRVPASLDFPLFSLYGENFPAYRGFMLLVSGGMLFTTWLLLKKTRIGLIIQAALTHPSMVSALGHNVPRVFTTRVRRRLASGRPRRGDRRQLLHHRVGHGRRDGADRVRGGDLRRPRVARRLLHRLDPDGHGADLLGRDRLVVRRPGQARSA